MNNIFPITELTETDIQQVAEILQNPSVRKYFHMMAVKTARQILEMYASDDNQTQKFLRDVAAMQGQIMVFNTLLENSSTNPSGAF